MSFTKINRNVWCNGSVVMSCIRGSTLPLCYKIDKAAKMEEGEIEH